MPDRPRIVLGMASSIDGKITTRERPKLRYGSDEDRRRLEARRVAADAVLIGKGQLVSDDPPLLVRSPECRQRRLSERGPEGIHPVNCVVTSRLDLDISSFEFFNHAETRRVVFTTGAAPAHALALARRHATVEVVGAAADGRVDLQSVVRRMGELGWSFVTLEGGGTLNFAMLQAGLVDEIQLTLCPFVFGGGGGVPTSIDGDGFPKEAIRKLQLASCETSATGEAFLRYLVEPAPAAIEPAATFSKAFRVR
ncbi:MAG: RibD family protein [Candidatus Wallbacteria bacterium]|nr:RibD family protein [Candidatus Wallbacteria bacterium]